MSYDIGPKIGIEGEAAFKQSITAINAQLKNMGAEMKAVVSAYDEGDKSTEALTARNEVLGRSIDTTKQKISLLQGQFDAQKAKLTELGSALEKTAREYGANSQEAVNAQNAYNRQASAVTKLGTDLNNATANLNKMERELRDNQRAAEDTGTEVKDLGGDLEKAGKSAGTFGDMLKASLTSQAIISGVKAIAGGIKSLFTTAFDYNKEMESFTSDFKVMLGSAEEAEDKVDELKKMAASTPFEMSTLAEGTKTLLAFGVASEDSTAVLQQLGDISLGDAQKMETLSRAYGKMNSSGKVALENINMMIDAGFNPLNNVAARTGESMEEVYTRISSGTMSFEEIQQAITDATSAGGQFYQGMQTASATTEGLMSTLSDNVRATLGQIFQGATDELKSLMGEAIGWIDRLSSAFETGGFSGLAEALGGVLADALGVLTGYIPQIIQFGTDIILNLVSGLLGKLPEIAEAAVTVITQLADSLSETLPELIPVAVDAVLTLVDTLLDNIDSVVDAAIDLIIALADGLIAALPRLVEKAPEIVRKLVTAIVNNAPKLLTAAGELIVKLIEGIKRGLFKVGEAAGEIVATVVLGINQLWNDLTEAGKSVVTGIWEGIKGMGSWLMEQVTGFFSGIVNGVKDFLGIHSPSTVFAEFGEQSMRGFAVGMEDESGKTIQTAEELSEAILKAATGWVKDKKAMDELTAGQEADFWADMKTIAGLGADGLKEIDQKLYAARGKASKDAYNYSKKWIENEKFYNRLSAEEEVEAWERVVSRKNLLADEQAEAEKNLYTARQKLMKEQADAEQKLYDQQAKAAEEYQKAVEKRTETLQSFAGLFDEIKKDADVSGKQLLQNLRDQVAAFESWQADIDALADRGVTGDLLDELREMGPKAADEIHALTTLSDKQLDEYVALFAEKGRLAAEQAEKEIPPVEIPLTVAGGSDGAKGAATETVTAFTGAVKESLGGVALTGTTVAGTLEDSIRGAAGQIVDAAMELIERFCRAFQDRYGDFRRSGESAMAGLVVGLRRKGQQAIETARSIADAIIDEMNRALGIHSPSTVMAEMGGYMAEGLAQGFTRSMNGARSNMARSMTPEAPAMKAAEGTVNGILGGLSNLLPSAGGTYHIHIELPGGKELASVVFDPLRGIVKQRGIGLG